MPRAGKKQRGAGGHVATNPIGSLEVTPEDVAKLHMDKADHLIDAAIASGYQALFIYFRSFDSNHDFFAGEAADVECVGYGTDLITLQKAVAEIIPDFNEEGDYGNHDLAVLLFAEDDCYFANYDAEPVLEPGLALGDALGVGAGVSR